MKKSTSFFVGAGLMVPVLYYGSILVGSAFFPGYNHVTQFASELGSASARYPQIFNFGIMAMGVFGILTAMGFYRALHEFTGKKALPVVVFVLMLLFGVSMIMGGLFPMPDMRHGGYGLGVGVHLIPALIAAALWKNTDYRSLAIFLLVNTVVMIAMFAIMMGVGQMVTRANVGLFQRSYSLTLFPWIAVVSYVFLKSHRKPVLV